jgi:phosphoglycerol transferase MdoB-like AlkP superfamily enzyme
MSIFTTVIAWSVNYQHGLIIVPNILFNLMWIGLIVGITIHLKSIVGKVFYIICVVINLFLFLVNSIYYGLTGFFFSFHLFTMASEGAGYVLDTLKNANPIIFLLCMLVIGVLVFVVVKFPKTEQTNLKRIVFVCLGFIFLHFVTPLFLGRANAELKWDSWKNPRDVYENFTDANKNMKICGLYEYSFRSFYVSFFRKEEENPEELEFLEEAYRAETVHAKNEYTGIFEGKNVIFLQLEGLDDWLVEDLPNLKSMMEHAIVFNDHYSYYSGGGSTFNSELAVNTGLITPVTYIQNAYTFNSNLFNHSLANIFKERGYRTNAFHMNTGEYYSRKSNYLNWGYDNYFGLLDTGEYDDVSYELDRELILNPTFHDAIFQKGEPFMHYIITYTPHTPFTLESEMGKLLAELTYQDMEVPVLSEEEAARLFASETDYMLGLLMEELKKNDLLENTVIVAFADHYLYTLNDKSVLEQYKDTETHLVNHTPFFIWSYNMEPVIVEKVNAQIDILPTVLNLFGVEYVEEYYIGQDILSDEYEGYAFFSDYSWYDGEHYVENGIVVQGEEIETSILNEKNTLINELIQKNDLTLKYDYFRKIK